MDAKRSYTPRDSTDAIIGANGKPIVVEITERDIESTFKRLHPYRYRYLPSRFLAAFYGGNTVHAKTRLGHMARKPNLYLGKPKSQRQNGNRNYTDTVYELAERAEDILNTRGSAVPDNKPSYDNFAHDLMACETVASIELGCIQDPRFRFIPWEEILTHPNFPAARRGLPNAFTIPEVRFTLDKDDLTKDIRPDMYPFGVETDTAFHFFFLESDRSTEPQKSLNKKRQSIEVKMAAYLAALKQGLHTKAIGVSQIYIMFVAPTTERLKSDMQTLHDLTNGQGNKYFLFTTCPSMYAEPSERLKADGSMLTREWQRVGHPAFSFVK